jgi:hypothetical protein
MPTLSTGLLQDLQQYDVGTVAYYERPLYKQMRQWYAGQGIEWNRLTARAIC